jgi:hypothetical protein
MLEGSHHLPPYSILCVTPPHLHSNGTFSRDSQGRVLKLSQFGLSGLWQLITLCLDLRLGWSLKQTCSFPWELSNGVLHSTCTHRGRVDSQLLMVGSQTTDLTPSLSFVHNLCCRCPNGSCEAIFTSTLQDISNNIKNTSRQGVLTPIIKLWVFGSPRGLPSPHFGSVSVVLTLLQSEVATREVFVSCKKLRGEEVGVELLTP